MTMNLKYSPIANLMIEKKQESEDLLLFSQDESIMQKNQGQNHDSPDGPWVAEHVPASKPRPKNAFIAVNRMLEIGPTLSCQGCWGRNFGAGWRESRKGSHGTGLCSGLETQQQQR